MEPDAPFPAPAQPQRPLLQLIDEEEWFNLYGLRQAGDDSNAGTANDRELADRVAKETSYQQQISAKIFAQDDALEQNDQKRSEQLDQWASETIDIVTTNFHFEQQQEEEGNTIATANEIVVIRTNLKELAARSDTVFAMASNQHLFHPRENNPTDKNCLSLSLMEYSTTSVQLFLRNLFSTNPETIPPEFVIDACRLAHYLQCPQLLDSIVDDYLMTSIDHDNCRFLCKLADELSIPRLWEASVNHMLSSLDKFEQDEIDNNDQTSTTSDTVTTQEESNLWEDLSPALKAEIQALRGILRSSNRKQVYFSSYHEYLALLAEQLQYYKERLEDAQHCQANRLQQQNRLGRDLEELKAQKAANGWYRNSRLDRQIETLDQQLEGLSRGSNYAAEKIERQTTKVNALRALWKEQKKIFGACDDANPPFEKKR